MRVTIERIRDEISDRVEVATAWAYGMTGGRRGEKARMAGATVLALFAHLVLFWGLIVSHPRDMTLPTWEDEPIPVELWEVPPPPPEPEVQPVPEPVVPVEQPVDQAVETPVRQADTPEPVAQPQAVPAPQPNVVQNPRPTVTVKPVDIPDFTPSKTPTTRQQNQRDVTADNRSAPDVAPAPSPNLGVKKKKDDEALQARASDSLNPASPDSRNVTALNLHAPPQVAPDAPASVAPSGLASRGGAQAGGGSNATLPPGALQGANGTMKGGRSGVSQAIQNHNSCADLRIKGKPIPAGCNMTDLASQPGLGPKPDADFQSAAARRDANLNYKTQTGSTEYWQRVNASPQPGSAGRDDGLPKKGAYSGDKDQRVMTGSGNDPRNGQ